MQIYPSGSRFVFQSCRKVQPIDRSLQNLGATCYVNSLLQVRLILNDPLRHADESSAQVWYQDETFRAGVYACQPPANGKVDVSTPLVAPRHCSRLTVLIPGFSPFPTTNALHFPTNRSTIRLQPGLPRLSAQARHRRTARRARVQQAIPQLARSRIQEARLVVRQRQRLAINREPGASSSYCTATTLTSLRSSKDRSSTEFNARNAERNRSVGQSSLRWK